MIRTRLWLATILLLAAGTARAQKGRLWSTSADFEQGLMQNVTDAVEGQLQVSPPSKPSPLPYLWIPVSEKGTVVKVDASTGKVLGEYLTAPDDGRHRRDPSRTAVDLRGGVWVGNRGDDVKLMGSAVHVGLLEAGECVDRNGNGRIDTSRGAGDVRRWSNVSKDPDDPHPDDDGGVDSADDECIVGFVRTTSLVVQHVSVDEFDNVWVGGLDNGAHVFDYIDGRANAVVRSREFRCGGAGGVVSAGVLWSTDPKAGMLLRYDPSLDVSDGREPSPGSYDCVPGISPAGLDADLDGNLWNASVDSPSVTEVSPLGALLQTFEAGKGCLAGLAVTRDDGNLWVADTCSNAVVRMTPLGEVVATIEVGAAPTGIAIDGFGRPWVTCRDAGTAQRLSTSKNVVDVTVPLGGAADGLGDFSAYGALARGPSRGAWQAIHDSGVEGAVWDSVTWSSDAEQRGMNVRGEIRAADTAEALGGAPWWPVESKVSLAGIAGRFVQVRLTIANDPTVKCDPRGGSCSAVIYDVAVYPAAPGIAPDCENGAVPPDCLAPPSVTADANQPGYARGVVLVQTDAATTAALLATWAKSPKPESLLAALPASLVKTGRGYGLSGVRPMIDPALTSPEAIEAARAAYPRRSERAERGGSVMRLDDRFVFLVDAQANIERAAADIATDKAVVSASPDRTVTAYYTPNDQFYNATDLWGLFKVQAGTAWNTFTGSGVVVAVVDTGVSLTHGDLAPNLWTNPGEIAGNGIDDDSSGCIDDVHGCDYSTGGTPSGTPSDAFGHGTHVAGTIAAVGNNTIGVVGLAFGSRIMAVKALNNSGSGLNSWIASAINYAVLKGADVINLSLGGPGAQDPTLTAAVNYAWSMGVVVVVAAGNSNQNACGFSPASAERAITISATKPNDTRSSFSNFGVKIDVAAPGGTGGSPLTTAADILSTIPTPSALGGPIFTDVGGNRYAPLAGTSMATPHVAALAALVLQAHPSWTVEQVRQRMRQTADDVATPGIDTDSGFGRINAATGVATTTFTPPTAQLIDPYNCQTVGNTVPVNGYASSPSGSISWNLSIGAGQVPASFTTVATGAAAVSGGLITNLNTLNFADGVYAIRLRTTDTVSTKVSEDRNEVNVDNVFIQTPAQNALVSGTSIVVTGKAAGNLAFTNYILDWAPGCSGGGSYTTITTSATPVGTVGPLGTWNLAPVPNGQVTLRLRANFAGPPAFTSTDTKCVIVQKLLAPNWPVTVNHTPAFKSPKVADLNNDGTKEIILGASVFEPSGALRTGWTNFPGLGRTNPAIVDVDGDGKLDVIDAFFDGNTGSPNFGAPVVYAWRHDKSVIWSRTVQNPNTGATNYNHGVPSAVSAADVDGDGQLEIVFSMFFSYFNPGPNYQTWVFVLNASTGVVEQQFSVPGMSQSSVALADLDGNGVPELILDTYRNGANDGMVHAVKYNGVALAGWPVTVPSSGDIQGYANIDPVTADIDNDCVPEVLIGKRIFRANGTLLGGWPTAFIARSTGVMAQLDTGSPQLEAVTGGGNSVVYSNYTWSGSLSNILSNSGENLMVIMMGENGNQGNPIVADVNGDGAPDVLRPDELGWTTGGTPMKIYGAQGATTTTPVNFPLYVLNDNPSGWADPVRSSATVDDVDNDGQADVLIAAAGQIYWWKLQQTYNAAASHWPQFQHDLRNTGNIPTGLGANVWATGASMLSPRSAHTETLLPSGKVLVTGGYYIPGGGGSWTFYNTTETYNPATNTWAASASMAVGRRFHAAALMSNGKVLVAGGENMGGPTAAAEFYNPATNLWTSTPSMANIRVGPTLTALNNGKVLVAGGQNGSGAPYANAQLYDPAFNTWSAPIAMISPRAFHRATLLPSGKVLLTGGRNSGSTVTQTAEVFDPGTNTFSATANNMTVPRHFHTTNLIPSTGKVLVSGGNNGSTVLANVDLYDPTTNSFTVAASMVTPRYMHTGTTVNLCGGRVLVAGAYGRSSAELYNPQTNAWTPAGNMSTIRGEHTATWMPSVGKALITGGYSSTALSSTDRYTP